MMWRLCEALSHAHAHHYTYTYTYSYNLAHSGAECAERSVTAFLISCLSLPFRSRSRCEMPLDLALRCAA